MPIIKRYDFAGKKAEQKMLSKELREASGLTFTRAGRLLCHNDEDGNVYEIDH